MCLVRCLDNNKACVHSLCAMCVVMRKVCTVCLPEVECKACVLCVAMNVNLVCLCKNGSKANVVEYKAYVPCDVVLSVCALRVQSLRALREDHLLMCISNVKACIACVRLSVKPFMPYVMISVQ